MRNQLLRDAQQCRNELVNWRRKLHTMAETGFDLVNTRKFVWEQLVQMGYAPKECGRCGIIADLGQPGKTILLRADMDALPIREETGLAYASLSGDMHACGHDLHTAMLLGAAKLLKDHESGLKGRVRLMFQGAEETLQGAADMIENGALKGVDAAMMLHVTIAPLPTGTAIISSPGVSAPAADYFTVQVNGHGCHGSAPQDGVDAITAAAHILIGLQEIQARELGIGDQAVLTVGTIRGGSAANAITGSVCMAGTVRTPSETVRHRLKQRMEEISRGIATAFRTEAEVIFGNGCPCLENDAVLSGKVTAYLKELLGSNCAYTARELDQGASPSAGGSEDFAYISQCVPSVMIGLAAGNPSMGYTYPLHHPKVRFDEDVLPYGAAIHTCCAMQWLSE